jgi:hypothetical protein
MKKKNSKDTRAEKSPIPRSRRAKTLNELDTEIPGEALAALVQRANLSPNGIQSADATRLQRTIGNQAVGHLAAEPSEADAAKEDGVAETAWQQILNHRTQLFNRAMGGSGAPQQTVQRQEEEELQTKPAASLRRQEEEELQMKAADPVQRQPMEEEEEMLQPKLTAALQRQEEEEVQMKRQAPPGPELSSVVQRQGDVSPVRQALRDHPIQRDDTPTETTESTEPEKKYKRSFSTSDTKSILDDSEGRPSPTTGADGHPRRHGSLAKAQPWVDSINKNKSAYKSTDDQDKAAEAALASSAGQAELEKFDKDATYTRFSVTDDYATKMLNVRPPSTVGPRTPQEKDASKVVVVVEKLPATDKEIHLQTTYPKK